MTKWFKKTYVCGLCDALIEISTRSNELRDKNCFECNGSLALLSVVDATIDSSTDKKEEQLMETTIPAPVTMTLDWVENDVVTTKTYTESDVRHMVWQNKGFLTKQNEWYTNTNKLRSYIEDNYADSSDQEALAEIAEMFDISLTKEVEYTAWVRVDMTIEVDLTGDFDNMEELIAQNLTVDSYGSEISVNNFDIDRVEEGAY